MAASFIPALVIKHNNSVYLDSCTLEVGHTDQIPTPGSGAVPDGDYWAVPITDEGIVTGFQYWPTTPDSTEPPTPQSFHVFRLVNRFGNDVWYVRGSTTFDGESPANPGYIQAAQAAECCDAPIPLPTDVPPLAGCQTLCYFDENDLYFAIFGLPTLGVGQNYFPVGYFNGEALPAASASGYASTGALLTFLNSGAWGGVGVWSVITDSPNTNIILKVTQNAGTSDGTDVLCVNVSAITP